MFLKEWFARLLQRLEASGGHGAEGFYEVECFYEEAREKVSEFGIFLP